MLQHAYANVHGIRLHYVTAGIGRPLLFLHGHPDFWYLWKDQIAIFQHSYRVVAPDLRGYNLSDKPVDVAAYRLPELVEDIRALVEHVGHMPITLVAHDWGAVIAWEFAVLYPAYLDKLVIISSPPLNVIRSALRDSAQRQKALYQLMVICPQAERILGIGDHYLYDLTVFGPGVRVPPGYFTKEDRVAYHEAWSQPGALTGAVNYYRAAGLLDYFSETDRQGFLDTWKQPDWTVAEEHIFAGLSITDVFGEMASPPLDDLHGDASGGVVPIPTLMIVGDEEGVPFDDRSDWFERRVPHGTLIHVPNAGHRIIHEQSALVTAYLQTFLGSE